MNSVGHTRSNTLVLSYITLPYKWTRREGYCYEVHLPWGQKMRSRTVPYAHFSNVAFRASID